MSAYLQTACHGDIISLLPILYAEWKETGVSPTLIVSKEYSEIPLSLDWLTVVVWDGDWQDLAGALKFSKRLCGNVIVAQVFGNDFPIRRLHPSWQYDQWHRCGRLHDWGKLPLVLPESKNASFDIDISKPFILCCDHSRSSPLLPREALVTLLTESFPTHRIVRASGIRLPRILDFLPIMRAADLLVCIDSMHLHLSAAVTTPVIALCTDAPSRWRGSGDSPRFSMFLRYSDFQARQSELVHVARKCLQLKNKP